jgi:hypothetical protein
MKEPQMHEEQDLPQPSFRLTWRDGTYRVSRPNVGDTDCYTADQMRDFASLAKPQPVGGALTEAVEKALEEMGCCNYNSAAERLRHALATLATLSAPAAQPGEAVSDEALMHLWDTRCGFPTENYPLLQGDVLYFARAVLALATPIAAQPAAAEPTDAEMEQIADAIWGAQKKRLPMSAAILFAREVLRLAAPALEEIRTGGLSSDYCKGFADGQAVLHPAAPAQAAAVPEAGGGK